MTRPLTLHGRTTRGVVLTYRTPAESVRSLLPAGLELRTHGPWAFWSVLACRVEGVRATPLPAPLGLTAHLVAYRLMVQAMTDGAEMLRGLLYVHTHIDAAPPAAAGDHADDFPFHRSAITLQQDEAAAMRCCVAGELPLELAARDAGNAAVDPTASCFATPGDARRFLADTSLAMTAQGGQLRLTRVQRGRPRSRERTVLVDRAELGLFDALGQTGLAALEIATRIEPVDCRWTLGETVGLLMDGRHAGPQAFDPLRGEGRAVAVAGDEAELREVDGPRRVRPAVVERAA